MQIYYDFHIHSALSPCADKDMTPLNIAAMASAKGLGAIAVSDHNSIKNVAATMECGSAFGITVLPAVEVQTAEDIHILALFPTYEKLEAFFTLLKFPIIPNRPDIFGEQLIINSDGEIVGKEENLLHTSATIGIYQTAELIIKMGGKAIPAHIDREANGILAILGDVPPDLTISRLEFSPHATDELMQRYAQYKRLVNSDAHCLLNISDAVNCIEAQDSSIEKIWEIL
ncbi:MAG: PHP domain-containing protein [Clostridia bacterium]